MSTVKIYITILLLSQLNYSYQQLRKKTGSDLINPTDFKDLLVVYQG